ncbi:MAG TPA: 2'-5' RNA ligase family protein [Acidimicrobiales bacterium]|nr:2'-5' RNA ligase family protein [Acidimicrobiales bacterium]
MPAAEELVGPFRASHDPVAVAGVPAHITLIVPWLAPGGIAEGDLADLASIVEATPGWDFDLIGVRWFGDRVLWLAPEPAAPFLHLTSVLAARFATAPWGGEFEDVVPHLTVAHRRAPGDDLQDVEAALWDALPVRAAAREVWVMEGDGRRWSVRASFALA